MAQRSTRLGSIAIVIAMAWIGAYWLMLSGSDSPVAVSVEQPAPASGKRPRPSKPPPAARPEKVESSPVPAQRPAVRTTPTRTPVRRAPLVETRVVHRPAPAQQPVPQRRLYTVRDGDTLSAIARKMYGHPTLWPLIRDANQDLTGDDGTQIRAGMILEIPPASR